MPDFKFNSNFPIASVIDAAGRNAQLQVQARDQGNKALIEGLQSIGQIGQSLYDTKRRVAESMALGKALDIPEELSRTLDPTQVLQAAQIKKGFIGSDLFLQGLHAQMGLGGAASASPAEPAKPASGTPQNGAILASDTSPAPVQPPATSLAPHSSIPVPIAAPPVKPRQLNPAEQKFLQHTADMAIKNRPEAVITQGAALAAGSVPKGTRIINPNTNSDEKEQDKLEAQARQGLQSVRGDTSIKNVEGQRDAAITAYNRLKQIEFSGKAPNPVDYVDILGQVYKARTGTAPTDVVLRDARQQTVDGKWGEVFTFFTGKQAPATTKNIAASLKDMVAHMGLQADELHEGYMQVHGPEIFPSGLEPKRVERLSKVARGKSFTDATGVKAEDYDPHIKAIKWAQENPNDPRSGPILEKAMKAKQGTEQSIGL